MYVLRVELANAAANGASDCALLRIELAEAPLHYPRRDCNRCHILLGRSRIRPRRVGELLRIEVAEAPLHFPRQGSKQQRIR